MSSRSVASALSITPVGFLDLVALQALEKACFGPDAWGYLGLVSALLTPGQARLKAVVDEQVVGVIIGEPHWFEGVAWIATLGVHPDYRRHGIGEALLAACEAALRQPTLKLAVRRSNGPAIALYRKFGYQQVGVWPAYYRGGEDGIVMEKRR